MIMIIFRSFRSRARARTPTQTRRARECVKLTGFWPDARRAALAQVARCRSLFSRPAGANTSALRQLRPALGATRLSSIRGSPKLSSMCGSPPQLGSIYGSARLGSPLNWLTQLFCPSRALALVRPALTSDSVRSPTGSIQRPAQTGRPLATIGRSRLGSRCRRRRLLLLLLLLLAAPPSRQQQSRGPFRYNAATRCCWPQ